MNKAYNIFLCLIIFALIITFLPKISKLLGYKKGANLFSFSKNIPFLNKFLEVSNVFVSFNSGNKFQEGKRLFLSKFFRDSNGVLFAIEEDELFKSFNNGVTWYVVSKITGLKIESVLEVERDGKIILNRID